MEKRRMELVDDRKEERKYWELKSKMQDRKK